MNNNEHNTLMRIFFTVITLTTLTLVSCQKDDDEIVTSIPETKLIEMEGELVFSKHYDNILTRNEQHALYENDFLNFRKNKASLKGAGTSITYNVKIKTGDLTNADTNGKIKCWCLFDIDNVQARIGQTLNYVPKRNTTQYFTFRVYPSQSFDAIQLRQIQLTLFGGNGWYVSEFDVTATGFYQEEIGFGSLGTKIYTDPNVWLDNDSSDPTILNSYISPLYEDNPVNILYW